MEISLFGRTSSSRFIQWRDSKGRAGNYTAEYDAILGVFNGFKHENRTQISEIGGFMNFIVLHGNAVAHFGTITREDIGVMVCGVSGDHELCYSDTEGYLVRTELEKPEDFEPFKYIWEDGAFKLNPDFVPPPPSNAELHELVKKLKEEVDAAQLALAEMYEGGGN